MVESGQKILRNNLKALNSGIIVLGREKWLKQKNKLEDIFILRSFGGKLLDYFMKKNIRFPLASCCKLRFPQLNSN